MAFSSVPYSSTMSYELFVHVIDLYAIDTQDSDIPSERIDPRLLSLSLSLLLFPLPRMQPGFCPTTDSLEKVTLLSQRYFWEKSTTLL